jgi:RNA polymerase sigma-70 factor (ECF subfamily)
MNKNEKFLEYRNLIFSIAYDMLGSVNDAEDIINDVYLKWISIDTEEINHAKAYLVKIATNMSINYLNIARKKREQYSGLWLPEPIEREYETRPDKPVEIYYSLSIGMLMLLEKLTAIERAVFLLREVFSYDYSEISGIVNKSEDNCRQIFKRAKQHLSGEEKRFTIDIKSHENILNQFLDAANSGNMDALINLLKDDITLYADGEGQVVGNNGEKIKALSQSINGKKQVANFVIGVTAKLKRISPDTVFKIKVVNNFPAIVIYIKGNVSIVIMFELFENKITNIYAQGNPLKLKDINKNISSFYPPN